MQIASASPTNVQFTLKEKIQLAGKNALRSKRAFCHRFEFAALATKPGNDQTSIGKTRPTEKDGIYVFRGHFGGYIIRPLQAHRSCSRWICRRRYALARPGREF